MTYDIFIIFLLNSEVKVIVLIVAQLANTVMEIEENFLFTTICKSGCDRVSPTALSQHHATRLITAYTALSITSDMFFWDTRYFFLVNPFWNFLLNIF